jgi:hypothetical protein
VDNDLRLLSITMGYYSLLTVTVGYRAATAERPRLGPGDRRKKKGEVGGRLSVEREAWSVERGAWSVRRGA